MQFTYQGYLGMLKKLKRSGYTFADYDSCDQFEKCVILRHDIDTDIDQAVRLAKFEAEEGVKSTFFVLLTSEFYNIAAKDVSEKIKWIKKEGHVIGLHFDEMNYNEENPIVGSIKERILKEVEIMEKILNVQIRAVSMHRPSKMTLEADYDLGGIVNSYSKKFFKEYKYVSDSRRCWREDVEKIITCGNYNKLHILTHAFWYHESEKSLQSNVSDFVNAGNADRYRIMAENITDMEAIMKREEIR